MFELSSGNVYFDLGFSPAEAESLLMRSKLMLLVDTVIRERNLTQTRAARLLGVSQPRVSDVIRGRIERFTIDALVEMLAKAGVRLEIVVDTGAEPLVEYDFSKGVVGKYAGRYGEAVAQGKPKRPRKKPA